MNAGTKLTKQGRGELWSAWDLATLNHMQKLGYTPTEIAALLEVPLVRVYSRIANERKRAERGGAGA